MPITPPYVQDAAADPAWRTVDSKIICVDEQVPDPEPGHRVVQTHTPAGQRVALWQEPVLSEEDERALKAFWSIRESGSFKVTILQPGEDGPEPEWVTVEPEPAAKPKRRRSRKTDEAIQGAS